VLLKNILTSILAFVATNVDDIFILMLLYGNRKIKPANILVGQSLGIATLLGLSFIGAYVADFVDQRYVGLLGLFPIYLAVREIIAQWKTKSEDDSEVPTHVTSVFAIAGITIANGGDNIGVYIPLLTTMAPIEKIQMDRVCCAGVCMVHGSKKACRAPSNCKAA
jgi:cadmium resistance protein CadD (predicted permease)